MSAALVLKGTYNNKLDSFFNNLRTKFRHPLFNTLKLVVIIQKPVFNTLFSFFFTHQRVFYNEKPLFYTGF